MKRRACARASSPLLGPMKQADKERNNNEGPRHAITEESRRRKKAAFFYVLAPPCSLNLFDAILRNFKSEQFER